MNKTCEIVRDLLPLYCDNISSSASSEMVKEHILECPECQTIWNQMQNGSAVNLLGKEANEIISHHNQVLKRKSLTIGGTISAVLAVPMLITFIVNLTVGKTLDWFFIVLTSLFVAASVTVVPIVIEMRKAFFTIVSFTASLLLLLLSSCLYSRGDWFFMASISVLLGISILFMPLLLKQLPKYSNFIKDRIGLFSISIDTLLLYATVITAVIYTNTPDYFLSAILITSYCLTPIWTAFFTIRYTKLHALTKAGIVTIIVGLFYAFTNDIIYWIEGSELTVEIQKAVLSSWTESNFDANSKAVTLIFCILIGVVLIMAGRTLKKRQQP